MLKQIQAEYDVVALVNHTQQQLKGDLWEKIERSSVPDRASNRKGIHLGGLNVCILALMRIIDGTLLQNTNADADAQRRLPWFLPR